MYLLVLVKVIIEIIQKLSEKETIIKSLENTKETTTKELAEKIVIRYNRVNHSIYLSNILYIESLSDYIKVVTLDDELVTKERISKISSRLPPYFKRIHRSFIVNSQKVNSYNSEFIKVEGSQIPISRSYKKEIITYLNNT
jgi:DNA-binding LytR/AlgR family response regulator